MDDRKRAGRREEGGKGMLSGPEKAVGELSVGFAKDAAS